MFKSKLLQKQENLWSWIISPAHAKSIFKILLAIKKLIFERFSNILQVLLQQIETDPDAE